MTVEKDPLVVAFRARMLQQLEAYKGKLSVEVHATFEACAADVAQSCQAVVDEVHQKYSANIASIRTQPLDPKIAKQKEEEDELESLNSAIASTGRLFEDGLKALVEVERRGQARLRR